MRIGLLRTVALCALTAFIAGCNTSPSSTAPDDPPPGDPPPVEEPPTPVPAIHFAGSLEDADRGIYYDQFQLLGQPDL